MKPAAQTLADGAGVQARVGELESALEALRSGVADAFVGAGGSVRWRAGSEEPYVAFFREMGEGGVTIDVRGSILHANPRFAAMVERAAGDLCGTPFVQLVAAADRPAVEAALASGERAVCEIALANPRGSIPARVSFSVVDAAAQRFRCAVITDLSERAKAEAELRIAAIAFETQDGIVVTDAAGTIVRVNRAFCTRMRRVAGEVVGRTPALFHSARQDRAYYERMWDALRRDRYWQGEIWNARGDGSVDADWLTISAVAMPDGAVTHYVGIYSDIARNREAEAEIHRLAYFDPLTRLPNRRLLQDRVGQALASATRHGKQGALLFLDLDNFKQLNDTRGHDVGDRLLVGVAQRIRECVRACDTVARLGGDEFVVMLEELSGDPNVAARQARRVGEKIRAALARPYELQGREFHGGASVGVALFSGDDEGVDALLRHADLAMYRAKTAGRNTLRFFDPEMQTALNERSALESALRQAIARSELWLAFQPQLDGRGRVVGAEALLRWNNPERGVVAPSEFIPIAEETGLIDVIGGWALESACRQIEAWARHASTRRLQVAVNVSGRQFLDADFLPRVRATLARTGADPRRLKVELTESIVVRDIADAVAKMQALDELGIACSLDDFGTGNSSLAYLTRLLLRELKIDQSFVSNLPENPRDAVMAHTIVTMATSLGLDVVAEGVETAAQREFLRQHGCRLFQGYLFARPMAVDAFERFVSTPSPHAVSA